MRKHQRGLKHQADLTILRGQAGQIPVIQQNTAGCLEIRAQEAGDEIQKAGFAAAAFPHDGQDIARGDTAIEGKELPAIQAQADLFKHQAGGGDGHGQSGQPLCRRMA